MVKGLTHSLCIPVFVDEQLFFEMAVFILPTKGEIPLHDHPNSESRQPLTLVLQQCFVPWGCLSSSLGFPDLDSNQRVAPTRPANLERCCSSSEWHQRERQTWSDVAIHAHVGSEYGSAGAAATVTLRSIREPC